MLPVQAVTAVIYVDAAWLGAHLFLQGCFQASLLVAGLTTQLWRVLSEFLRADYRGAGRLSAYQWMALVTAAWLAFLAWWLPLAPGHMPLLAQGLAALWGPGPLLLLQGI